MTKYIQRYLTPLALERKETHKPDYKEKYSRFDDSSIYNEDDYVPFLPSLHRFLKKFAFPNLVTKETITKQTNAFITTLIPANDWNALHPDTQAALAQLPENFFNRTIADLQTMLADTGLNTAKIIFDAPEIIQEKKSDAPFVKITAHIPEVSDTAGTVQIRGNPLTVDATYHLEISSKKSEITTRATLMDYDITISSELAPFMNTLSSNFYENTIEKAEQEKYEETIKPGSHKKVERKKTQETIDTESNRIRMALTEFTDAAKKEFQKKHSLLKNQTNTWLTSLRALLEETSDQQIDTALNELFRDETTPDIATIKTILITQQKIAQLNPQTNPVTQGLLQCLTDLLSAESSKQKHLENFLNFALPSPEQQKQSFQALQSEEQKVIAITSFLDSLKNLKKKSESLQQTTNATERTTDFYKDHASRNIAQLLTEAEPYERIKLLLQLGRHAANATELYDRAFEISVSLFTEPNSRIQDRDDFLTALHQRTSNNHISKYTCLKIFITKKESSLEDHCPESTGLHLAQLTNAYIAIIKGYLAIAEKSEHKEAPLNEALKFLKEAMAKLHDAERNPALYVGVTLQDITKLRDQLAPLLAPIVEWSTSEYDTLNLNTLKYTLACHEIEATKTLLEKMSRSKQKTKFLELKNLIINAKSIEISLTYLAALGPETDSFFQISAALIEKNKLISDRKALYEFLAKLDRLQGKSASSYFDTMAKHPNDPTPMVILFEATQQTPNNTGLTFEQAVAFLPSFDNEKEAKDHLTKLVRANSSIFWGELERVLEQKPEFKPELFKQLSGFYEQGTELTPQNKSLSALWNKLSETPADPRVQMLLSVAYQKEACSETLAEDYSQLLGIQIITKEITSTPTKDLSGLFTEYLTEKNHISKTIKDTKTLEQTEMKTSPAGTSVELKKQAPYKTALYQRLNLLAPLTTQFVDAEQGQAACATMARLIEQADKNGDSIYLPASFRHQRKYLIKHYKNLSTDYFNLHSRKELIAHYLEMGSHLPEAYDQAWALLEPWKHLPEMQPYVRIYQCAKGALEKVNDPLEKSSDLEKEKLIALVLTRFLNMASSEAVLKDATTKILDYLETTKDALPVPTEKGSKPKALWVAFISNEKQRTLALNGLLQTYENFNGIIPAGLRQLLALKKQALIVTPVLFTALSAQLVTLTHGKKIIEHLFNLQHSKAKDVLFSKQVKQSLTLWISGEVKTNPGALARDLATLTMEAYANYKSLTDSLKYAYAPGEKRGEKIKHSEETQVQEALAKAKFIFLFELTQNILTIYDANKMNTDFKILREIASEEMTLAYGRTFTNAVVSETTVKEKGHYTTLATEDDSNLAEFLMQLDQVIEIALNEESPFQKEAFNIAAQLFRGKVKIQGEDIIDPIKQNLGQFIKALEGLTISNTVPQTITNMSANEKKLINAQQALIRLSNRDAHYYLLQTAIVLLYDEKYNTELKAHATMTLLRFLASDAKTTQVYRNAIAGEGATLIDALQQYQSFLRKLSDLEIQLDLLSNREIKQPTEIETLEAKINELESILTATFKALQEPLNKLRNIGIDGKPKPTQDAWQTKLHLQEHRASLAACKLSKEEVDKIRAESAAANLAAMAGRPRAGSAASSNPNSFQNASNTGRKTDAGDWPFQEKANKK